MNEFRIHSAVDVSELLNEARRLVDAEKRCQVAERAMHEVAKRAGGRITARHHQRIVIDGAGYRGEGPTSLVSIVAVEPAGFRYDEPEERADEYASQVDQNYVAMHQIKADVDARWHQILVERRADLATFLAEYFR